MSDQNRYPESMPLPVEVSTSIKKLKVSSCNLESQPMQIDVIYSIKNPCNCQLLSVKILRVPLIVERGQLNYPESWSLPLEIISCIQSPCLCQ